MLQFVVAAYRDVTTRGDVGIVARACGMVSLLTGVVSLFGSLHADVFFCADRDLAYAGILCSLVCTTIGGVFAVLSGYSHHRHEGYALWQPFRGGLAHTILQYFGWLFFGVSVTMYIVFALSFERFPVDCKNGTVAAVGCLSFAAVLLLIASIPRFDPHAEPLFSHLTFVKTDNLVVVACLAASTVFSCLIEGDATILRPYRHGMTASLFFVNVVAVVLVVFLGRRRFEGKKIFHPFQGGFYFVLMQSSGWAGVGVATFFFLRFAVDHMLPGMLIGVTFLQNSATWLLLLSLDCFEEAANVGWLRKFRLTPEIVAFLIIGVIAFVTITICDLAHVQHSFLYYFSVLCQSVVPPLIHVYASLTIRGYKLWQPFSGGSRFIILHGIAWTLYACVHMVILLALWNSIYAVVAAASLFVFVADAILCSSLSLFEDDSQLRPESMLTRRASAHRSAQPMRDVPYLNGELVTSMLMAVGGLMTITVGECSQQDLFHKGHICIFGIVVMILAPILAQVSGRKVHPAYALFRPFYGGADHVALQTVGWTLWGVMVVVFSILEANLLLNLDLVPFGASIAAGVSSLFSYALIVASIPLFQPTPSTTAARVVQLQVVHNNTPLEAARWSQAAGEAAALLARGAVESPELQLVLQTFVEHAGGEPERLGVFDGPQRDARGPEKGDDGMGFLSVTLSGGSAVLGICCELLHYILRDPLKSAAVGPTSIATSLACLSACFITHFISGTRRYPSHYRWWMPFAGGSNFSLLQTIGWALVSVHISLFLSSLYSFFVVGDMSLFAGMFFAIGFFGFAGHMFLLVSLSQFDADALYSSDVSGSFLHRHSEWFLGSILTVVFIAAISVVEGQVKEGRSVSVSTMPLLVGGVIACFTAVMLAWTSALKSLRGREHDPTPHGGSGPRRGGSIRDLTVNPSASSPPRHVTLLSETVVGTLLVLWVLQRLSAYAAHVWVVRAAWLAVVHHGIVFLWLVWREHRSAWAVVLELAAEVVTFVLYSFHYLVITSLVYVGFFWRLSAATVIFFVAVNALSLGSDYVVRFLQVAAVVCMLSDLVTLSLDHSVLMGPFLLYTFTYAGSPQIDRSRSLSPRALEYLQCLWDAIARYFHLRVVATTPLAANATTPPGDGAPGRKIIYGFHPHGVCPYTCLWATMGSAWKSLHLPKPVVHVSSYLMAVPVVRDVLLALGVADCTLDAMRASCFDPTVHALLLVPGGQQECFQATCAAQSLTLFTKNKGLFRFALQHGATLVPMFSFGETDIMGGLPLPSFQVWAQWKLGITYPQLPHGRLMLPIPKRVPLYIAVGAGITVHPVVDPKPSEVDALHATYYDALAALFDRHKAAAGYANAELRFL